MQKFTFNLYRTDNNALYGSGEFEFEPDGMEFVGAFQLDSPSSQAGTTPIKGIPVVQLDLTVLQFQSSKNEGMLDNLQFTLVQNPYQGRLSYGGSLATGTGPILNLTAVVAE